MFPVIREGIGFLLTAFLFLQGMQCADCEESDTDFPAPLARTMGCLKLGPGVNPDCPGHRSVDTGVIPAHLSRGRGGRNLLQCSD